MNSIYIAIGSLIFYLIAYYTYGRFLARKLFNINPDNVCPSHSMKDGVDYVPTPRQVLFGHHFASIAGTGPIVGPAIAVIWGWLPALLWVLFGSVLMGAVHDFGSLVISLRKMGRSIGDIAGEMISPRVKILFLLIIFFLLLIVIAVFGVVIGACFTMFPESVLPIWIQIPIAMTLGYLVYYRKGSLALLGIAAVLLMFATTVAGAYCPIQIPATWPLGPTGIWVVILLVYAYIASIMPVQWLLQPRDFINSFQLLLTMLLLILGVSVAQPSMVAPAVRLDVPGAPPMFPMLFVIIACGAISGFHSLVSSGTSSKQCDNEKSALFIGYGAMLTEGMLAVFVIIACCAGLGMGLKINGHFLTGVDAFNAKYPAWIGDKGLNYQLSAFVTGATNMIAKMHIPAGVAATFMYVFIAAFASTTLDTATRIQRYIVEELAIHAKMPVLAKKHPATFIAVGTALLLAFHDGAGKGALALWPLFGSLNQLLAGLALLVVTMYLAHRKAALIYTLLPMLFMIGMTGWAMLYNVQDFWQRKNYVCLFIALAIVFFELWMIIEGILVLKKIYFKAEPATAK